VHARFIFSVYTLITFFSFRIKRYISSFYAVSLSSQQIHITFHLELLDQFERNILSKWKIFYSSRNILAIKGPSFFRIPSSQISPSLTTIYIWTSARELVSFWLIPYRKERKEEKTRATRAVRITFILSPFPLSPRDSQRSVNTTKWRHIVPRVMAATCLSRCSYSMVNEIYRVLHHISS